MTTAAERRAARELAVRTVQECSDALFALAELEPDEPTRGEQLELAARLAVLRSRLLAGN